MGCIHADGGSPNSTCNHCANEEISRILTPEFEGFGKIARLSRDCVITEKIDGANAQVYVTNDGQVFAGSRTRWVTPEADNYGFAKWVREHEEELRTGLGPGRHFGEWWGQGIQRGYGLSEKRFSLFNTARWQYIRPDCCHVVPILYEGLFQTFTINRQLDLLQEFGSLAAETYNRPEGIVIYHKAADQLFKKTIEKDEAPKGHA